MTQINELRRIVMEKNNRIVILCPHPSCEYKWEYKGRLPFYATCPSCRRNVKIRDNQIMEVESA
jgi:hypothetical protein